MAGVAVPVLVSADFFFVDTGAVGQLLLGEVGEAPAELDVGGDRSFEVCGANHSWPPCHLGAALLTGHAGHAGHAGRVNSPKLRQHLATHYPYHIVTSRALIWTNRGVPRTVWPEVATPHQTRIGKRIARARNAKGWTQHQLADAIGVNDSQISRYETGRHTPKPHRYEALANALEVPAESFFYDPPGR